MPETNDTFKGLTPGERSPPRLCSAHPPSSRAAGWAAAGACGPLTLNQVCREQLQVQMWAGRGGAHEITLTVSGVRRVAAEGLSSAGSRKQSAFTQAGNSMRSWSCPRNRFVLRLSAMIWSKGKMPSGHFTDTHSCSLCGWLSDKWGWWTRWGMYCGCTS